MTNRRNFLIAASASLVCSPAVVRSTILMPVHSFMLTERRNFGFVERLYVHANFSRIRALQHLGLSAHDIAAKLNRDQIIAINGVAWDAHHVDSVVEMNELICRADASLRAECGSQTKKRSARAV